MHTAFSTVSWTQPESSRRGQAELFVSLSLILNKVSCLVFLFVPWFLHTQHIWWNAAELHGHSSYSCNAQVVCGDDVLEVLDHFLHVVLKASKHSKPLVDHSVCAVTLQHGDAQNIVKQVCCFARTLEHDTVVGALYSFVHKKMEWHQCINWISLNSEPTKTTAVIPVFCFAAADGQHGNVKIIQHRFGADCCCSCSSIWRTIM